MRSLDITRAVVVLSGGQDSATVLAAVCDAHGPLNVCAITFAYGQRHQTEIDFAQKLAEKFGISEHRLVHMDAPSLDSALVNDFQKIGGEHRTSAELPASFVPARNATFICYAWGYAMEKDCGHIYLGVSQTDYSGYPDCRGDFLVAMQAAMQIGYQTQIELHAPLLYLSKAETFEMAKDLGVIDTILTDTITCYEGVLAQRDFGRGCGECPACKLRSKGYGEFLDKHGIERQEYPF